MHRGHDLWNMSLKFLCENTQDQPRPNASPPSLPPVSPPAWWRSQVRSGRDHYVRVGTCDYAVRARRMNAICERLTSRKTAVTTRVLFSGGTSQRGDDLQGRRSVHRFLQKTHRFFQEIFIEISSGAWTLRSGRGIKHPTSTHEFASAINPRDRDVSGRPSCPVGSRWSVYWLWLPGLGWPFRGPRWLSWCGRRPRRRSRLPGRTARSR